MSEYALNQPEKALKKIKKEIKKSHDKIRIDTDRELALRRVLNNCVWFDRGMDYNYHHAWLKVVGYYNENIPGHLNQDSWCFNDSKNGVRRLFGYDNDGDWGHYNGTIIEDFTLETLREIYKEGHEEGNELLIPGNDLFISGMQQVVEAGNSTSSDRLEMLLWAKKLVDEKDRTNDIYGVAPMNYEDLRVSIQQILAEK